MPFDPTKPFEVVDKGEETAKAAEFDPNQPFETVEEEPVKKKEDVTVSEPLVSPEVEAKTQAEDNADAGFWRSMWNNVQAGAENIWAGIQQKSKYLAYVPMRAPGGSFAFPEHYDPKIGQFRRRTPEENAAVAAEFEKSARRVRAHANKLLQESEQLDGDFTDLIDRGDYGGAARSLAYSFANTLPTMMAYTLNPITGTTTTLFGTAGQKELELIEEMEKTGKVYTPTQVWAASWGSGATEAAMNIFLTRTLNRAGKLFNAQVKAEGTQAAKSTLKNVLEKSGIIAFAEEGGEEALTRLGNNMIDKYGLGKDVDLTEGLLNDMLVGGFIGQGTNVGGYASGKAVQMAAGQARNQNIKNNYSKLQSIDQELANPLIRPEVKEQLMRTKDELAVKIVADITRVQERMDGLTKKQRQRVYDIGFEMLTIDEAINDPDISASSKTALQDRRSILEREQESIEGIKPPEIIPNEGETLTLEVQQARLDYLKAIGIEGVNEMSLDEINTIYEEEIKQRTDAQQEMEAQEERRKDLQKEKAKPTPEEGKPAVVEEPKPKYDAEEARTLREESQKEEGREERVGDLREVDRPEAPPEEIDVPTIEDIQAREAYLQSLGQETEGLAPTQVQRTFEQLIPAEPEAPTVEDIEARERELAQPTEKLPTTTKELRDLHRRERSKEVLKRDPESFEEAILQFFRRGGRISSEDFVRFTGFGPGTAEYKSFSAWALKKEGQKLDLFAEDIAGVALPEGPLAIENEVIETLLSFNTPTSMLDRLVELQEDPFEREQREYLERYEQWRQEMGFDEDLNEKEAQAVRKVMQDIRQKYGVKFVYKPKPAKVIRAIQKLAKPPTKVEPAKVTVSEYQGLKSQLQAEAKGARVGRRVGYREGKSAALEKASAFRTRTKQSRAAISEFIRENYTDRIREAMGKRDFDSTIRIIEKAETPQKVVDAIDKIDSFVTDADIKSTKSNIGKLLKKPTVKRDKAGKIIGKLDKDFQRKLSTFKKYYDLSVDEINSVIEDINDNADGHLTNDQRLDMEALIFAGFFAQAEANKQKRTELVGKKRKQRNVTEYLSAQKQNLKDYKDVQGFLRGTLGEGRAKQIQKEIARREERARVNTSAVGNILDAKVSGFREYHSAFKTAHSDGLTIPKAIDKLKASLAKDAEYKALPEKERANIDKLLTRAAKQPNLKAASRLIDKAIGQQLQTPQAIARASKDQSNRELGFTPETSNIFKRISRGAQSIVKGNTKYIEGFEGLIERVGGRTKEAQSWIKSKTVDKVKASAENFRKLGLEGSDRIDGLYQKVYKKYGRQLYEESTDLGLDMKRIEGDKTVTDTDLEQMSLMDILDLYIKFKNPATIDQLVRGNKYTESAVDKLMEHVGNIIDKNPELQKLGDDMGKYYSWAYEQINPIYEEMYNIDMPSIEGYSPSHVLGLETEAIDAQTYNVNSAVYAPNIIARRIHSNPIQLRENPVEVALKYNEQMMYFTAFAPTIRDINSILSNKEVARAIKQKNGDIMLQLLRNQLNDIANNGAATEKQLVSTRFSRLMTRGVGLALGFNPRIVLTQLSSFTTYSTRTNTARYLKEFTNMVVKPKSYVKDMQELANSPFIRERWKKGFSIDVGLILRHASRSANIIGKFEEAGMIAGKFGDTGAILLGGTPLYRAKYKEYAKTMPLTEAKAKAYQDFVEASRVQQSRRPEDLSAVQKENGVMRMFTPFMSSKILYMQRLMSAGRNISNNRGSMHDIKVLVSFGFTQGLMYQMARMGFSALGEKDDPEDELTRIEKGATKALIQSPLQGVPLLTTAIEYISNSAIDGKYYNAYINKFEPAPNVEVINDAIDNIQKTYDEWHRNGASDKFKERLWKSVQNVAEIGTGVPWNNIKKITVQNWMRLTGELETDDWRELLGYSKKTLGIKAADSKPVPRTTVTRR